MDIPPPNEGDINIGTDTFRACWALTGLVGVVLIFRLAMKAWVRWALPQVSAPGRVWGLEDGFFVFGYAADVLHMTLIQHSYIWGLGRHFFYLTPEQRVMSLKWDFASQPAAVAAAMISRTGMMWFLLSCFANSNRRLRISIIICMIVQIVVNSITIVQIVVQCGPNPYRAADRTKYFHYMWDPLPTDGSVVCQSPKVQTTIGFVQGGFNTVIDLYLGCLAAFELWQFFIQTLERNPGVSFWAQFKKINSSVRSRRIWQTMTLCGPLFLSGAASIVKTYLLKSLGDRADFTYNIVSFVLWVKIENYSILIATCAPVIRLFLRSFVDMRREGRYGGYPWSRSHSSNNENSNSNSNNRRGKARTGPSHDSDDILVSIPEIETEDEKNFVNERIRHENEDSFAVRARDIPLLPRNSIKPSSSRRTIGGGSVTVKTDIVVKVDEESRHSLTETTTEVFPRGERERERGERQMSVFAWTSNDGHDRV
ncbi:hypothetical protein BGW36DRAFT_433950 [Talaromyces proteolyticus]|uniref:Rhodopsin domain-containing protein n=1 Tax=Talaromyces proteolyticus TaxID=1131652 RepID=A0AAD4KIP4_9EURO|nr:uncharacterized protein BGW36DRAFT_433950 [Talaromyces proteolyticus]KAH8689186.1 hypothetical protein BGW36DRAFT_433950 [Talaromyces proteolyticus]